MFEGKWPDIDEPAFARTALHRQIDARPRSVELENRYAAMTDHDFADELQRLSRSKIGRHFGCAHPILRELSYRLAEE
jgi:hypothetical protein